MCIDGSVTEKSNQELLDIFNRRCYIQDTVFVDTEHQREMDHADKGLWPGVKPVRH